MRGDEPGASALLADLERADAREGWDRESGAPHPTGAHTSRVFDAGVGEDGKRWARSRLYARRADGHDFIHCQHGPALVRWVWQEGSSPLVHRQEWHQDGWLHRGEGPAVISSVGDDAVGEVTRHYYWRGKTAGASRTHRDAGDEASERLAALLAAGAESVEVVGWLLYEHTEVMRLLSAARKADPADGFTQEKQAGGEASAHTRARTLITAGTSAQQALDATALGIFDVETIAALARGELPLSWAVAGAVLGS